MRWKPKITFYELIQIIRFSDEEQCLEMLEQETRPAFRRQIYGRFNRLRNKRERLNLVAVGLKASKHRKPRQGHKGQPLDSVLEEADLEMCNALLTEELMKSQRASVIEKIHRKLCKIRSEIERKNNYRAIK